MKPHEHTYRQTDEEKVKHPNRQTDREGRETVGKTNRQKPEEPHTQPPRQTDRQTGANTAHPIAVSWSLHTCNCASRPPTQHLSTGTAILQLTCPLRHASPPPDTRRSTAAKIRNVHVKLLLCDLFCLFVFSHFFLSYYLFF